MNKTDNYNLSQWSLEDRVRMEDFNADNAAIEAALTALAAETKRVDAELAKKALASDLTSQISGLQSGKLEFATLLNTSFTASGSSYSVTVPGKEMGNCVLAAAFIPSSSTLTNNTPIYANTGTNSYHCSPGSSSSAGGLLNFYRNRHTLLIFFPMKQPTFPLYGLSFAQDIFGFFYSAVTYSSLTSLTIKLPTNGLTSELSGSASLRIYGIR